MEKNYVNNHPGSYWEKNLTEKEIEIISYQRSWFWGATPDKLFLMKRLLERIHKLEDEVQSLKSGIPLNEG